MDGNENAEKVFNFFVGKGLQPYQAAAIAGNMHVESGILPQRLQGTDPETITTAEKYASDYEAIYKYDTRNKYPHGWGVVQWDPGVKFINNVNWNSSPDTDISKANDLGVQVQFVWDQLEGRTPIPEKQAGTDVKNAPTIEEAVLAFQGNRLVGGKYVGYERPADQQASVALRTSIAVSILAKYGSGSPATASTGTLVSDPCSSGTEGNGSTVGDGKYALPVPQRFFDQHPEWFSKPHHDYPSADIPVPRGTPVYAAISGKVIIAPANGPGGDACYGRGLYIQSGDIWIVYGHGYDGGSIPGAKQGDTVQAGQLIMHVDDEGCSQGNHLHFDVRVGNRGNRVCPQNWLMAVGRKQTPPDMRSLPTSGCSY